LVAGLGHHAEVPGRLGSQAVAAVVLGEATFGDAHTLVEEVAEGLASWAGVRQIVTLVGYAVVVDTVVGGGDTLVGGSAVGLTGEVLDAVATLVGVDAAGRGLDASKLLGAPGASGGADAVVLLAVPSSGTARRE